MDPRAFRQVSQRLLRCLPSLLLLAAPVVTSAQTTAFQSPGMSEYSSMGQTTRFSNEFNPALGFVIDAYGDWVDPERGPNGGDLSLRLLEFNGAAYVDPDAWAYLVLTTAEFESVELEEAAVVYTGFEGNSTVKVGRFFVDFGKQMQTHLEELHTLERPLVLREFLGHELAGTGIQYDYWFAAGDVPVRFSLGAFASLLESHDHGDAGGHDHGAGGVEGSAPDRKDLDEFSVTARLTGMVDVGESSLFQAGLSARHVPEFAFDSEFVDEATDQEVHLRADGLSNTVFGADATFGWQNDTGMKSFTGGLEYLVFTGDVAGAVYDGPGGHELVVQDEAVNGLYAYADHGWTQYDSLGLQFSTIEEPAHPDDGASELDLYVTHHFTEFRRVRLGVTLVDADHGGDETRVYVQFTNFFGSHAHGINW